VVARQGRGEGGFAADLRQIWAIPAPEYLGRGGENYRGGRVGRSAFEAALTARV
jgi:hypothetical protein